MFAVQMWLRLSVVTSDHLMYRGICDSFVTYWSRYGRCLVCSSLIAGTFRGGVVDSASPQQLVLAD